jgi:hypothetical protein
MISYNTICLLNKERSEVTDIKKLIRDNGLFLAKGAMNRLTDPEFFTMNSIDLITLVFNKSQCIGWAAVICGLSEKPHAKDKTISTYPHVAAFMILEFRNQGLIRQALDILISEYKALDLKKEYSFKTFGYSESDKIFKPSLLKMKLRSQFVAALPLSEISISFGHSDDE